MGIQETWTLAQAWPTMWQGHGGSSLWFSFLIHKMRDLDIKLVLRLLLILGILGISSEMGKSRHPQSAALSPNTKVSLCSTPIQGRKLKECGDREKGDEKREGTRKWQMMETVGRN